MKKFDLKSSEFSYRTRRKLGSGFEEYLSVREKQLRVRLVANGTDRQTIVYEIPYTTGLTAADLYNEALKRGDVERHDRVVSCLLRYQSGFLSKTASVLEQIRTKKSKIYGKAKSRDS